MMKRGGGVLGLWLLVTAALLMGCADGGAYRSPGYSDAYLNPLPPALQNTDPALRHWYTAPYFNPYEMP